MNRVLNLQRLSVPAMNFGVAGGSSGSSVGGCCNGNQQETQ